MRAVEDSTIPTPNASEVASRVVVELTGIRKSFGANEVLKRRRPVGARRRARRDLRPVRLGQVDVAAHDQHARAADRRLGQGRRQRVRPGRLADRAAPHGRDGLPAVQPLPAPDRAGQHHAAAAAREGRQALRGRGAGGARAAPRRPDPPRRALPARDVGRPAAAGGDRARAGARPEGDALRRADVGARSRAGRRGARRDAQGRRVGHDDGRRHARARLRPRGRRPERLHGRRARSSSRGGRGFFETCSNPRTKNFLAAVL